MCDFQMPWSDGVADYIAEVEVTGHYYPETRLQPAEYPCGEVVGLRLDPAYGRRSKLGITNWHRHDRELSRDVDIATEEWLADIKSWHGHVEGYCDE